MMRGVLLTITAFALTASPVLAQGSATEYEQACDLGDLVDCTVLGLIYQTGASGARDLDRAFELYRRACRREVATACMRLDFLQRPDSGATPENDRIRMGYVAASYDGAPLGGAIVRVRGRAGVPEGRYVSDVTGRVVLPPLPYGTHRISVQRGGYLGVDGDLPVPWDGDFLILMEEADGESDAPAFGQIFGRVTDEGSGAAISDVEVVVSGLTESRTISNGEGRFFLSELPPGDFEVRFERLGFEPRTTTVTVQRGRTLEVTATMSVRPVELEPVEVSVGSRYLERSGFYRRAQFVPGDRFTFRDIERLSPMSVADLMRRVAGVTVVTSQIGAGVEALSNRRSGGGALGRCRLQPYYNGVPMAQFDFDILPPEEIEALEVYQGPNVPIEYLDTQQVDGPSCGVILIWTRDPGRTR